LGVDYQLVTDYTAMLVVDDATFKDLGIERNNQQRTAKEEAAQATRDNQPAVDYNVGTLVESGSVTDSSSPVSATGNAVDTNSAARANSGSSYYGDTAGALGPFELILGVLALAMLLVLRRRPQIELESI
ncbi:MAG: hypothetical protein ACM3ZE_17845, partial [Myxococcales bacterium]